MKTRVFENPIKFAQSVKIKVDGEYVSLLELLQNADIELDETPTSGSDKAVSSGGVYSALQEKQGQISITKNDDGSVDIIIPTDGSSAGGGSSGGSGYQLYATGTGTLFGDTIVINFNKEIENNYEYKLVITKFDEEGNESLTYEEFNFSIINEKWKENMRFYDVMVADGTFVFAAYTLAFTVGEVRDKNTIHLRCTMIMGNEESNMSSMFYTLIKDYKLYRMPITE